MRNPISLAVILAVAAAAPAVSDAVRHRDPATRTSSVADADSGCRTARAAAAAPLCVIDLDTLPPD